jgi:hypothetical protein
MRLRHVDKLVQHIPIEPDWFPDWLDSAKSTDPCLSCGGSDDEGLRPRLRQVRRTYHAPCHAHCVFFKGPVEADWLCPDCDEPAPKRARA